MQGKVEFISRDECYVGQSWQCTGKSMNQKIKAIYRSGAFVPREMFHLPEESEVSLTIEGQIAIPPKLADPVERARVAHQVTERMRGNPLPQNAPRLTRDALHGRG
jgi:hypothetical protein